MANPGSWSVHRFESLDQAKYESSGFVTPVNEILIMKDNVRAATGVVGEIWLTGHAQLLPRV